MMGSVFRRPFTGVLGALLVIGATAIGAAVAQGGPKKSDSVVKFQVAADPVDASGVQIVSLVLTIDDGWHIYANPAGNEDLTPVQTTVTAQPPLKPEALRVAYPTGRKVDDPAVGTYQVYDGRVVLKAAVQRTPGVAAQLNVKIQACCHILGQEKCLLPAVVPVTLP